MKEIYKLLLELDKKIKDFNEEFDENIQNVNTKLDVIESKLPPRFYKQTTLH